ncbi:SDR family NAD(P)-dependent oxidoreductase [Olivibacter domesticus]|uniref:Short-chain dehydrogenase n=1 Tax=Olivibacter domesticus TaxID=407022 RepID=A0A1H7KFA5_OLID1|nr:SDR family oxidoreductase [Olivibacter domesticus]SEK85498.1 hypothetical protein SAMN05661044_01332 [Olivibacter domesticus]
METSKNYTLITGATSGIGYELAKLFAEDGHNLILIARSLDDLEKVGAELSRYGVDVITISKDLFDRQAPLEIYDEIRLQDIAVNILVNDAGQGVYGEFIETDLQKELDIVQLNISACIALTKMFLRDMVLKGEGKILNLSSIAGKIPGPYQAVYHGTKAFVHFFSEAVRSEVKGSGVTITSLLPGATDTDFFNKAEMQASKIVQEGEMADPAEVAKDGYDALMAGKDMVISGFKNKMQVAMGNITPDSAITDKMGETQAPVDKKND